MTEDKDTIQSHEVMRWLSDDVQRQRYAAAQETFETDGWKLIVEYALARAFEAGLRGANAQSWEQNREALGARKVWDEVASLGSAWMNEFEEVARQNKLAAVESSEDVPE